MLATVLWLGATLPDPTSAQPPELESFIDSAVFLRDERGEVGTGFLVGRIGASGEPRVFLVMNRHALPEEGPDRRLWLRTRVDKDGRPVVAEIALTLTDGQGRYLPSVLVHPDPGVDLAAMHVTLEVGHFRILTGRLDASALDASEPSSVGAGSEVWVVGYPGANFDGRNAEPLVLGGVLATDPAEGFAFNDFLRGRDGLSDVIDGFLVHSTIVPGSSGSMVVSRPEAGTKPRLLGVVSRSLDWVGQENGPRQGLGLGIVFSAVSILEVIEGFDDQAWTARLP